MLPEPEGKKPLSALDLDVSPTPQSLRGAWTHFAKRLKRTFEPSGLRKSPWKAPEAAWCVAGSAAAPQKAPLKTLASCFTSLLAWILGEGWQVSQLRFL